MSRPVSSTSAGRRSSKFSCGRHSINTTWLKRPEKINPQLSGLIEIGSLSVRYVHSLNAPAFFENNDLDASFPTVPVERVTAIDAVGLPVTFKNKNGQVGMALRRSNHPSAIRLRLKDDVFRKPPTVELRHVNA